MAPFDVVILDLLVSGGMGGKEAIRHLLDFDPGAKCVVSSGYSGEFLMGDYREYGFRECLAKPYNVTQLGQILKNVLISPNECIRE
jgi:DNA-binding NarL/FixJ family response regulator